MKHLQNSEVIGSIEQNRILVLHCMEICLLKYKDTRQDIYLDHAKKYGLLSKELDGRIARLKK